MTIDVFAPAKVNLSLRVGPPGANGRHPLDSLVCFTRTCGDTVTLKPATTLSLIIDGPFAPDLPDGPDDHNLVLRAARLLQAHSGGSKGADITLTKRLPVASGVGGGSADGAAALVGLNHMWGVGATNDTLQHWAAPLGADVPACVLGESLLMTGTGETILAVGNLPRLGIILINPLVPCPTEAVYQKYDQIGTFAPTHEKPLPELGTAEALLSYLYETPNDLEAAAIALVPQIGDILSALEKTKNLLLARMSGSGATCFGLYPTLADAQVATRAIKNALAFSPIWVEADEIN